MEPSMRNVVVEVWIVVCSGMLAFFEPELKELNHEDHVKLGNRLEIFREHFAKLENDYQRVCITLVML